MSNIYIEDFYTTDYDEEIVDYIKSKFRLSHFFHVEEKYLKCGNGNSFFWFSEDIIPYAKLRELTKSEFKEKIGMPIKSCWSTVTVKGSNSVLILVTEEKTFLRVNKDLYLSKTGYMPYHALLTTNSAGYKPLRMYEVPASLGLNIILGEIESDHELVWESVDPLRVEELQKTISDAKEVIDSAEDAIDLAEEELRKLNL